MVGTCIVGSFNRSFIRKPDGTMDVFVVEETQTFANDINDSGVVVGYYAKEKNTYHGFLYSLGVATPFDYPGATFTQPLGINAAGAVTGLYEDSVGVHGFVRDSDGSFSSFDPPGSDYTVPWSTNTGGEVAGFFYGGSAATQGFVRDATGNITVFTVPNAYATTAFQINDSGSITGWWDPANNFVYAQGYTRDPSGTFTTFVAPGTGPQGNTYSNSINASGEVTGYAADGASPYSYFGFIQSGAGTPVEFSDPLAVNMTEALKINNSGLVVGSYSDGTTGHDFVGKP